MQVYSKLIITFILFALTALGAYRWQEALLTSFRTYRSPLAEVSLPPGEPLPAQTPRVVLIILGGLGFDALEATDLPTIRRLQDSGASALIESQPPTYRQPAWHAILSGAHPTLNDGEMHHIQTGRPRPITIETIFHTARKQNMVTALAGTPPWQAILTDDLLNLAYITPLTGDQGDRQIVQSLAATLEDERVSLTLIYFSQIDEAGLQTGGPESPLYQAATKQLDSYLDLLMTMIDLDRTTVLITADHGHIDGGGFGGHDVVVRRLPLIMVGRRVIPGTYSPVEQVDIAPTVAALLGTSIPAANQGRPLTEMIQLSTPDRAQILVSLAQQRITLMTAYLSALGATPPDLNELKRAWTFLDSENYNGAAQLAELLIEQANQAIEQAQLEQLAAGRPIRLLILIGLGLLIWIFVAWRRTELWSQALFSGLVVVGVYHGLYQLMALPYSFSAVDEVGLLWVDTVGRMGLSLLAGSLFFVGGLILKEFTDAVTVLQSSYEFLFFAALGFFAPSWYAFWQYGLTVGSVMPSEALLFLHHTSLIQGLFVIGIGIIAPSLILFVNFYLQQLLIVYQRRQIEKVQTRRP